MRFLLLLSFELISAAAILNAVVHPVNRLSNNFPGSPITNGISVSGGGSRSFSAATGQFRALQNIGNIADRVDAISTVSGGTWFTSIFMFQNSYTDEELLGRITYPHLLTLKHLNEQSNPLSEPVTNNLNPVLTSMKRNGTPTNLIWQSAIARNFLDPFHIGNMSLFMAGNLADVEKILKRNPGLSREDFLVQRKTAEFIMGGILEAAVGYQPNYNNVASFQMTPSYVGSPFAPNLVGKVIYHSSSNTKIVRVGGGFIESFAFGKQVERQVFNNVQVDDNESAFSLAHAVGISSAAFTKMFSRISNLRHLTPSVNYSPIGGLNHDNIETVAGDGGNLEGTGLLALLARNASLVLVLDNPSTQLPSSSQINYCNPRVWENAKSATDLGISPTDKVASFFGFAKSQTNLDKPKTWYGHNHVFLMEQMEDLFCQVQMLMDEGKPAVVRGKYTTINNSFWGISANRSVEVMWVLLTKCSEFEKKLPQETQEAIQLGDDGPFANFPHFKTAFQNGKDITMYTRPQVNLLAAQTEYTIIENKGRIKEFFQL